MSKFFSKENFHVIVLSLISSVIFLLVLEPLIHIGKDLASNGLRAFIDYFFYSCGHMSADIFLTYSACVFILLLIWVSFCLVFLIDFNFVKKASDKTKTMQKKTNLLDCMSKMLNVIFVIVSTFLFLNTIMFNFIPILWKANFERRIVQITPYVEAEKINLLKSNWVSMETENDYDLIYKEIYQILDENNLPY